MPELPEVETIRQGLRLGKNDKPSLLGLRVVNCNVLWQRSLVIPGIDQFIPQMQGQIINEIDRRGKFLIFRLDHDDLLIHLRMSGDLWVEPKDTPAAAHHRLIIDFEEPWRLAFNDPRKFGRVWLVKNSEQVIDRLGPEPLDSEFTANLFFQMLQKYRRQIKPLLMDQQFLAGMGNIYTDEALNLAHIHPLRLSADLTWKETSDLWNAVRFVLQEGIKRNGASIDWVFRGGDYQNYFRVYGRLEEPCPDCGMPINRMKVGQRSTYYCPICQVV